MPISFIYFLLIVLVLDVYAYRGMRKLFSHRRLSSLRSFVLKTYWLVDILFMVFALAYTWHIRNGDFEEYVQYRKFFVIAGGFLLVFLPKIVFFVFTVFYDLKILLIRLSRYFIAEHSLTMSTLQHWRKSVIIPAAGFLTAAFMFSVTLYGVGFGRFDLRVVEQEIWFDDLPEAFDGYRIVHFSDTHLGSFTQTDAVQAGLDVIKVLEPDLIVFTGDLVNNGIAEAIKFVPLFRQLRAADGMYSVLGNHDMGDYRRWGTIDERISDVDKLVELQTDMGFRVLLNEHVYISRGNDSIMLAGVKNWGLPPFGQFGDLHATIGNHQKNTFSILLSHDPSHWRAQILPETDIHLTLSGHTHGMQFGITNKFFSWSPVQLKYDEWSGLYQEGAQKIYVNTGFGYLSFPGRIGMPPEITLIVLRKTNTIALN